MSKRIHSLEGREERICELGNAAHGKQELTCWRGGRGRSRLASSEMWHIANKVPSWGRKREEWVSELGNVACCKMGTNLLGGRKGEEGVGELGKGVGGKKGSLWWGGREGGGREVGGGGGGRGRDGVGKSEMVDVAKQGITIWRGGRGRSGLVSLETWHVTNEDSQTGGEEEEDQVSELGNVACHK